MDRGRFSFSDFRPIQSLPRPDVNDVPSPSQEYSDNYDFYRSGLGLWVNTNMTPDFPLAADALWLTYEATTGDNLDGVVLADPFALKALMHVTDPVEVGSTGIELTDKNIVPFVSNQAYAAVRHCGGAEARAGTGRASRAGWLPAHRMAIPKPSCTRCCRRSTTDTCWPGASTRRCSGRSR